jgi:hypothetical protein
MEASEAVDSGVVLNLFCSREGEASRVYVRPGWLPRHLHQCLDDHGEAYPVELDFDDLERHMHSNGATYEKKTSSAGGVELTARARSANILAVWLATALASGVRPRLR